MIHGCFFHMHEGCANFQLPKTRTEWWAAKLARNRARDAEVRAALEAAGWRVIVVWECETGVRSAWRRWSGNWVYAICLNRQMKKSVAGDEDRNGQTRSDRRFDPGLLRAVNSHGEPVNRGMVAKPLIPQAAETPYRFGAVNTRQRKRMPERRKREDSGAFGHPSGQRLLTRHRAVREIFLWLPLLPEKQHSKSTGGRKGTGIQTLSAASDRPIAR